MPLAQGPIWGIPGDWDPSDVQMMDAPSVWHYPPDEFEPIWNIDTSNIAVAVLDTGCNDHEALPKPVAARSFIRGESWKDPRSGHGTHCAGTILGRYGIGFAPKANLMVGKVLSNGGSGASSGIAAGINWAIDEGADVISMSLGGSSPYEPTRRAIMRAFEAGIIVVAAAGNSGYRGRNTIGYPSKFDECLCIAAYRRDGQIADFSSGGSQVDVACPGQAIVSCSNRGGYVGMSGTSMATPYAAGYCAADKAVRKREGEARITSAAQMRVVWSGENVDDRGQPGHDPRWGMGVPKINESFARLKGYGEAA